MADEITLERDLDEILGAAPAAEPMMAEAPGSVEAIVEPEDDEDESDEDSDDDEED